MMVLRLLLLLVLFGRLWWTCVYLLHSCFVLLLTIVLNITITLVTNSRMSSYISMWIIQRLVLRSRSFLRLYIWMELLLDMLYLIFRWSHAKILLILINTVWTTISTTSKVRSICNLLWLIPTLIFAILWWSSTIS